LVIAVLAALEQTRIAKSKGTSVLTDRNRENKDLWKKLLELGERAAREGKINSLQSTEDAAKKVAGMENTLEMQQEKKKEEVYRIAVRVVNISQNKMVV
jgi:hypothetical protein